MKEQPQPSIADMLCEPENAIPSIHESAPRDFPTFNIGEVLIIRGGSFKVHAISGNRIYLDLVKE